MAVLHVEVEGRVQGVGFRWFVRQFAQRKGLGGWVMNRADGCVEVAAKGSEERLDQLRRELKAGPPGAEVIAIRDLPLIDEDSLSEKFTVRR